MATRIIMDVDAWSPVRNNAKLTGAAKRTITASSATKSKTMLLKLEPNNNHHSATAYFTAAVAAMVFSFSPLEANAVDTVLSNGSIPSSSSKVVITLSVDSDEFLTTLYRKNGDLKMAINTALKSANGDDTITIEVPRSDLQYYESAVALPKDVTIKSIEEEKSISYLPTPQVTRMETTSTSAAASDVNIAESSNLSRDPIPGVLGIISFWALLYSVYASSPFVQSMLRNNNKSKQEESLLVEVEDSEQEEVHSGPVIVRLNRINGGVAYPTMTMKNETSADVAEFAATGSEFAG